MAMEMIEVAPDGWTFRGRESHRRFVPFGTNAVMVRPALKDKRVPSYFVMHEWEWDAELFGVFMDHVAEVGMNLVKFFMPVSVCLPDPQPPDHAAIAPCTFDILDQALDIARTRGVYLMPTLSEWGGIRLDWWHAGGEYVGRLPDAPAGSDALAVVTDFWRTAAARYKGRPELFAYNLAVEWLMPNGNMSHRREGEALGLLTHPAADDAWRYWLQRRYGSAADLERAWRNGTRNFAQVTTPTYRFEDGRYVAGDQVIYDYQEFREWVCYRYLKAQADAIRSVDDAHLVSCGLDPRKIYGLNEHARGERGEGGAKHFCGYSATELDFLDFIPMHEYVIEGKDEGYCDRSGEDGTRMRRAAVNHLRFCYTGKPVILEEFGHQGNPDAEEGAARSEQFVRESAVACGGWLVWFFVQPDPDPAVSGLGVYELDGEDGKTSRWTLTPWGRRLKALAQPGGFLDSLPRERPAARQVVELDRHKELVPYGPTSAGYLVDHWDEYEHPLDFVWPRNPHLRLR